MNNNNNDKNNKPEPDYRSTLDRKAQEARIEKEVKDSMKHMPKSTSKEDDEQEDWSWGDCEFGE